MPTTSNSASDAIAIDVDERAHAVAQPQQRQAEEHREQQHLQDLAARERADDRVGDDVQQEVDRAQMLGAARVGGNGTQVRRRRIETDAAPGFST